MRAGRGVAASPSSKAKSTEEWARLEAVLLRLLALAGEIAPGFRHAWGGPEPGVGLGELLREWLPGTIPRRTAPPAAASSGSVDQPTQDESA